jgi:hypothetical protein
MDLYQCTCGHHVSQHSRGEGDDLASCRQCDCEAYKIPDSPALRVGPTEENERKRHITTEHEATAWKAAAILRALIEEDWDLQPAWEFVLNLARGGYFNPRSEW